MKSKKIKIALIVIFGLMIVGVPLLMMQGQSLNNTPRQPLVYRYTGWWDGLNYNVLSGNRPDMKEVRAKHQETPGYNDGTNSGSAEGTTSASELSDVHYRPRALESALGIAVFVDTSLGLIQSNAGAITTTTADTTRAYVALVADGVARDIKIFEPHFVRVVLDSVDSPQTPFLDSLDINYTGGTYPTAQIYVAGGGLVTGGVNLNSWDVIPNSEIVKVAGSKWSRVANETALAALPSTAKCYAIDYGSGLVTLRDLDSSQYLLVECVLSSDKATDIIDPGVRYGGYIYDDMQRDTSQVSILAPTPAGTYGPMPTTALQRGFFDYWGRISDIEVLKRYNTGANANQYINIYGLDTAPPDDSSYLFNYSWAKYDNSFTSLSITQAQRYRGSLSNPTAISVISARNSDQGVRFTTTVDNAYTSYTVTDSIRIFLTEAGSGKIRVINGSIGIDAEMGIGTIYNLANYPDRTGPYDDIETQGDAAIIQWHHNHRTARGGSRLSFFPDTITYTLSGDSINQQIYFNRHEQSFSVVEWPTVWVDEDADGTFEDQEEWVRVANLTVVGDTGAYELNRFADPDGSFTTTDAYTEYGGGRLLFGNGVHGRKPAKGTNWTAKIAYYPCPDMFVFDNTYADSTSGASGQISQPTGIAARYNDITGLVDVYVGDRGHSVVKKYTWDENAGWSYKFRYQSKFGQGLDPVSISVGKYFKNTNIVDSSDVYVYVADYSHDKVIVFRDEQALNPALTTVPEKFIELGGTGTELGQFYRPTDVCAVVGERAQHRGLYTTGTGVNGVGFGGQKIDLYVADWGGSNSGRITKLEGISNQVPTITLSLTGGGSCGGGNYIYRHPESAFSFNYSVTDDELATATVGFYFAPTDTSSLSNCLLIESGIAAPTGGNGTYSWMPSTTSGMVVPDTGYLLGVILDKYGQNGSDYSTQSLIINDSRPTIKFLSDYNCQGEPGDSIILVYEGEGQGQGGEDLRNILVYLENPDKIIYVNVEATFDTSIIEIVDIVAGDALGNIGGEAYEFYFTPSVEQINSTGMFAISGVVKFPATNEGIMCSGALARISYRVDTTGINTDDKTQPNSARYKKSDPGTAYQGITINTSNSLMIRNIKNGNNIYDTLEVKDWKGASLFMVMLGDIASANYYNNFYRNYPAPNMIPDPDGRIDNEDVLAYVFGWNGFVDNNLGYQDPVADIFPSFSWKSGLRAPYLFARPDCKWEPDDVITFGEMYSWFRGFNPSNTLLKKEGAALAYEVNAESPIQFRYVSGKLTDGQEAVFDIYANKVEDLSIVRAILDFNSDEIEVAMVEEKDFMSRGSASSALFKDMTLGQLDLAATRFAQNRSILNGSGVIARVYLRAKSDVTSDWVFNYQYFNGKNELVREEAFRVDGHYLAKLGLPKTYDLAQNYPNPFNPSTEIHFALPEDAKITLKIYNIAGELVKTLVDERKAAGNYSMTWNGTNDKGRSVAAGVYFYQIETGKFNKTKKMLLLK